MTIGISKHASMSVQCVEWNEGKIHLQRDKTGMNVQSVPENDVAGIP